MAYLNVSYGQKSALSSKLGRPVRKMRTGFGGFFIECTTDFTIPYAFTCESRLWISAQASTPKERSSRFKGRPAIANTYSNAIPLLNKQNKPKKFSELVEVEICEY